MHFLGLLALAISFASLSSAASLFSLSPAPYSNIIRTAYPVGNGRLAALAFGDPGQDKLNLNRDSLWSGGPFGNNGVYNGANPSTSVYGALAGIREWIWQNGAGNITALPKSRDDKDYGSYSVLGNLTINIAGITSTSKYKRTLDLDNGVHTTGFVSGSNTYTISTYCSYPDDVCVYDISSTNALPATDIYLENLLTDPSLVAATCSSGQARLTGITAASVGMTYDSVARIVGSSVHSTCSGSTLHVPAQSQKRLTLVIAAGTNYDETKGTAASSYSFRGAAPQAYVNNAVAAAASKSPAQLLAAHITDYSALAGAFTLNLPDTQNSAQVETATLIARYSSASVAGDPFLESLTFQYGRHLFISSSRGDSLPPSLQGKWAYTVKTSWGSDYHANINLQMNHWGADQTGLGALQTPLWKYMTETWAPRGTDTAKLMYDASGWTVHDEVNIFGHTGMKSGAEQWANYPASAAWMMQHVWDYYDYSQDKAWLAVTGYPLLKGIASFWVSQLQQDKYFNDGSLVVNPCDSPEHPPTTFGCAHWQQLIYQVFETTLQAAAIVSESDHTFTSSVSSSLSRLDKGFRIGSWGQVKEWKLQEDVQNDTHRHLSHLVGWYPGWSISSYLNGYSDITIQKAVATSLWSRGVGIADANAGWEKVWRSACWARLNETERAYFELRLTIEQNWAPNALSMYGGKRPPFQIDANFGYTGAVLSMLVVDLPTARTAQGSRTVVLGPAIPAAWAGGSVKGLRLRGGGSVDFSWSSNGIVNAVTTHGIGGLRLVDRNGKALAGT